MSSLVRMTAAGIGPAAFALLIALSIVSAVLETVGVALVYPLVLALVAGGDSGSSTAFLSRLLPASLRDSGPVLLVAAILAAFLAKNLVLAVVFRIHAGLIARAQSRTARSLMATYQRMSYEQLLRSQVSELLRNLTSLIRGPYNAMLVAVGQLVADVIVASALLAFLVIVSQSLVLLIGAAMAALVLVQHQVFRRLFSRLGAESARLCAEELEVARAGLAGFKEARVFRREDAILAVYAAVQDRLRRNGALFEFVRRTPPLVTETALLLGLAAMVATVLDSASSADDALATLAVIAAVAFRGLPVANRMLQSMNALAHAVPQLAILSAELAIPPALPPAPAVPAGRPRRVEEVRFADIGYCYAGSGEGVEGISFTIRRGELVAIAGPSGAGKSTLVDLLLGLLVPQSGRILVDGEAADGRMFAGQVGFVPQQLFLFNDTLRRNIAFALDDEGIEDARVVEALRLAGLAGIAAVGRLDRQLGEDGAALSGGQRQRVGLARALYADPDILVLDEPTTGLDVETEAAVFDTLVALARTRIVVVVTHRPELLERMGRILWLSGGRLTGESAPTRAPAKATQAGGMA